MGCLVQSWGSRSTKKGAACTAHTYLLLPHPLAGLTEAIGVAFTDDNTGYLAGGGNGVGPEILKSTDGGATFAPIDGINFGIDILLLDAAAAKNTIIVTSIGGELYSLDGGKNWRHSIGGGISQSIRYIGPIAEGDGLHFGIAGQHRQQQGVAITTNGLSSLHF